MIFTKIKKLIGKLRKPKEAKIKYDDSTNTLTNKSFDLQITGTSEPDVLSSTKTTITETEPIVEIKFIDETFCNNCEIPMIEKTEGITYRRKKTKPKKCLVCPSCGFERRLNY